MRGHARQRRPGQRRTGRRRATLRRNAASLASIVLAAATAAVGQEAGWASQHHTAWISGVVFAAIVPKLVEPWLTPSSARPDEVPSTPAVLDTPGPRRLSRSRLRLAARWRRSGSVIPADLPVPLKEFRGRAAELKALQDEYNRQAEKHAGPDRGENGQTGPKLLLIHGMPGIGKTALAQAFAHRYAAQFPDGQLYANLGIAGAPRDPGEILDGFLAALGKSAEDRPTSDDSARSKTFRSMTSNSRMLILLDAARSPDQVRQLLPTGTDCLVIVTSRRDFGPALGAVSLEVSTLDEPDALQVLAAHAQTGADQDSADAARVVALCGALPLALHSAGGQLTSGQLDLPGLVRRLEPSATRLDRLRYRNKDVRERLISEYFRLNELHRRAFRMLGLVESPTFLAWTLAPLLAETEQEGEGPLTATRIGPAEAENIAAQLAGAQLLIVAGPAGELGTARYRLHPLVRLVAQELLAEEMSAARWRAAAARLDSAYAALVSTILSRREPHQQDLQAWALDPEWQPMAAVAARVSPGALEPWVRAEYLSLLRCIEFAHARGSHGLCWRIAALLGSCVPEGVDQDTALRAFNLAEQSARVRQPARAGIEVLLARGSFLAAVERYDEAHDTIESAAELTRTQAMLLGSTAALRLQAACHRRLGEAWLQLAAYRRAHTELVIAQGLAEQAGDDREAARVRLLITDNDSRITAEHWFDKEEYTRALAGDPDDGLWFRAHLGLSESERRDGRWDEAIDHLRMALDRNDGDARRRASILYRCARVRFCESTAPQGARNGALAEAIGYASAALLTFDTMRNVSGVIRARCLLADALIRAGNLAEGRRLVDLAERALIPLGAHGDLYEPLTARVRRSRGNLRLAESDPNHAQEACAHFREAAELFAHNGDWHSKADTLFQLGRAEYLARHTTRAKIELYSAMELFEQSRDQPAHEAVKLLIAQIDNDRTA